jgi:outer membrane biosynthesis protein TonB
MMPLRVRSSLALLMLLCAGCMSHKAAPPPALAPPLQTGAGKLSPPKTTQQQEKATSPLASPLPQPSEQSVPLPPPPPPKKVRHRVKTPKPAETPQTAATAAPATQTAAAPPQPAASPIGQLTTGDSAVGERTKHETADLITATQQGLNGIKRTLSAEEKVTAAQILTFLKQAQQALNNGDTDGGLTLATKAKLLLDELTKP